MAQRSTQRTDILSAARCSDILPESYLRNMSNLPVHRNIAQIGQNAPNRGLAYSTKFRCTCQDKFHFFLEKFLAVSFRGNCGGFGAKTRHIAPSLPIYLGAKELMDMAMAWLWTGMVAVSLIFGALTGNLNALSAAALEGAQSAVELCLAMCGVM